MSGKSPFVYVEDMDLYVEDIESQARSENLVAIVPAGIRSVDTLFSILSNALSFPYFGRNWDALYDLLRDFWWTDIFQITVVHRDIPALSTAATRLYLDILACCVEDWKPGERSPTQGGVSGISESCDFRGGFRISDSGFALLL